MIAVPRAHQVNYTSSGSDLVTRLMSDGAYEAALSMLAPRIDNGLADPVAMDQAATCHWHLQEGAQAMSLMQQIVDDWPQLGAPCVKLASYAASCGETQRASHALHLAFRRGHKSAKSLALLNRVSPIAAKNASARRLKAIAKSRPLPNVDRAIARNTLGKIGDRAGRHRAAFRWFASANQLHGSGCRPRDISALVAGQILSFDPHLLPKSAAATEPRMLVITGLPRSGTNVLEHSLSRHTQIRALGEAVRCHGPSRLCAVGPRLQGFGTGLDGCRMRIDCLFDESSCLFCLSRRDRTVACSSIKCPWIALT